MHRALSTRRQRTKTRDTVEKKDTTDKIDMVAKTVTAIPGRSTVNKDTTDNIESVDGTIGAVPGRSSVESNIATEGRPVTITATKSSRGDAPISISDDEDRSSLSLVLDEREVAQEVRELFSDYGRQCVTHCVCQINPYVSMHDDLVGHMPPRPVGPQHRKSTSTANSRSLE
jgi:hypothetical protein